MTLLLAGSYWRVTNTVEVFVLVCTITAFKQSLKSSESVFCVCILFCQHPQHEPRSPHSPVGREQWNTALYLPRLRSSGNGDARTDCTTGNVEL
jgi:hypothetical protein